MLALKGPALSPERGDALQPLVTKSPQHQAQFQVPTYEAGTVSMPILKMGNRGTEVTELVSGRNGIRPVGLALRLGPHPCSTAPSSPAYGHGFPAFALPSAAGYFFLAGFLAAGLLMDCLCPE